MGEIPAGKGEEAVGEMDMEVAGAVKRKAS